LKLSGSYAKVQFLIKATIYRENNKEEEKKNDKNIVNIILKKLKNKTKSGANYAIVTTKKKLAKK
jgi:hypothetical protein